MLSSSRCSGKVKKVWDKVKHTFHRRGTSTKSLSVPRSRSTTDALSHVPPPSGRKRMPRSFSCSASNTRYDARGLTSIASSSAPQAGEKHLEDILVVYNPILTYWQVPFEGLKFNVDATWDAENRIWIIAIVARDIYGGLVFGKVVAKENPKSLNKSFEGELFGVWQAAIAAREHLSSHHATHIAIETDSKHVAEHIDGPIEDKYMYLEPEILTMREEMLTLFNEVDSLDVFQVPRHCIKVGKTTMRE